MTAGPGVYLFIYIFFLAAYGTSSCLFRDIGYIIAVVVCTAKRLCPVWHPDR